MLTPTASNTALKDKELKFLEDELNKIGVNLSLADVWAKGGEGAIDLAEKVVKLAEGESKINFVYKDEEPIKDKIEKVAKEVYGAEGVDYTENALQEIEQIEKLGYGNYPVCIAKTQYSISDNKDLLGYPTNYEVTVKQVKLYNGAGFITIYLGSIITMPGLPKVPAANNMDVVDGKTVGLF